MKIRLIIYLLLLSNFLVCNNDTLCSIEKTNLIYNKCLDLKTGKIFFMQFIDTSNKLFMFDGKLKSFIIERTRDEIYDIESNDDMIFVYTNSIDENKNVWTHIYIYDMEFNFFKKIKVSSANFGIKYVKGEFIMLTSIVSLNGSYYDKIENDQIMLLKILSINLKTEVKKIIQEKITSSYKLPLSGQNCFLMGDTLIFLDIINNFKKDFSNLNIIKINTTNKQLNTFVVKNIQSTKYFSDSKTVYFIKPDQEKELYQYKTIKLLNIFKAKLNVLDVENSGHFEFINYAKYNNSYFFLNRYNNKQEVLSVQLLSGGNVKTQKLNLNSHNKKIAYIDMSKQKTECYSINSSESKSYLIKYSNIKFK